MVPPHVVESIQQVPMARVRAIDTGVGKSACNERISKARAAPRAAKFLFQTGAACNGGRQNESYEHSNVGL